ncbi:hypothetical protein HMPREF1576_00716 [Gardnerella pickettii JCP7719]|uniref:Uncharacterized protein n=2 Tax=Gardnerella pickettii TaxID=2914924 RepID=T2PKG6_9BIFI|nr:hypothetical protein HMPREF1577_01553 [Gardnerella pickettii JCP8017A]EPI50767.1 hypothetical protein HMPREF1576_00716 [Gardnerella pickettii JCP7719]EPI61400.1 hypothetical protein HMPREF1578_01007 [Gardnerella pickettii JCP8017B]
MRFFAKGLSLCLLTKPGELVEALGVELVELVLEFVLESQATDESPATAESQEPSFGVKRDTRKVTKASSLVVQS